MAHTPQTNLLTFLGTIIWGDLGDLTIYRNYKGKMVVYNKTWPKAPQSPNQLLQRQRFTDAAEAWQDLTIQERETWELATKKLSLGLAGYALFVHWQTMGNEQAIQTIERQSGLTLIP